MAERILLVCTANECRSPYAASVLHSMLAAAGPEGAAVYSAGLHVIRGNPLCAEAARRLAEIEVDAGHRARLLRPQDVESASLILVAESRHRAAIVRMSPTASARTFTLREAAALGAASRRYDASIAWSTSVEAFAARLHEARGLIGPIRLDIADGHHGTPREHRRTLDDTAISASAIANAFLGRVQPDPEHTRTWRSWRASRPSRDLSKITVLRRDET